ncbi:HD domain-containing protein [Candidatus Mycobacterium wuenschmannii]|uniref:HD domain-containing protein n=1 Tax=Candidatus Mycobacterium wuenschmannii TaxID=3027808 RepID=A0ABY8VVW9_9MYCO|nr:HD domain-containing protein [Candidatus Mycobacterium wuenschmannii]WIM87451.1 HD domain-containing protein [Candidatus Mycobacterium wuenschmannii]
MTSQTQSPRLTQRFDDALTYSAGKHREQLRKGGDIPYLGHLLAVAGYVIEAGGTENQVIAALLHDTAEDQGGEPILAEIREKFGDEVASIVRECSDTVVTPKPPWRERKENYINHLSEASDSAVLVSLADKLNNAHAILRDFRRHKAQLWERFSVKDPADHLWYYKSLLEVYRGRFPDSWMADELAEVLDALEREVGEAA